jgi:ABC-type lipoprotein release transport system permease subunit
MLASIAWRNLSRRRWLSIITGAVGAMGILLTTWIVGMNYGAYDQMIDQAVRTRMGHLQVLPEGYLEEPRAKLVIPGSEDMVRSFKALDGVSAVSPRAYSDGMIARDSEATGADIVGVVADDEAAASVVPEAVLQGDQAVEWCREHMSDALTVLGGDEALFERWCEAAGRGQFLPEGEERAIVIGSGMAERLLVSVGDEVTVQVVRAVDEEGQGDAVAGDLSQRRLEVAGIFRVGNPELDDRLAFVNMPTLTNMLGTDGPNEIVIRLENMARIDAVHAEGSGIVGSAPSARLYTWDQRNSQLATMIESDATNNWYFFFFLCVLVALGVVNTTFMSILWRTREFGVMLSLGLTRLKLFSLIMLETAFLGVVALVLGSILGGGLEIFGRFYGWNMEWFGMDAENMEVAGVMYDPIYYSRVSFGHGTAILLGTFMVFLLAGLIPAYKASRLHPVEAMRTK